MSDRGTLIHGNEAFSFIDCIKDPVTRNLVNMAVVKFVMAAHAEQQRPEGDLDLLYVAKVLEGFFAEHDIIARALQGERVGAFWEDEGPVDTEVGQPGSA